MRAHEFHSLLNERMKEKGYGGREIRVHWLDNILVPTDIIWDEGNDCFVIQLDNVGMLGE